MAEFYSAAAGQSPPLPWTNLSPPHTLDGSDANGPMSYPRVQYLSQQFVEDLCSSNGVTDELLREIERVIFEAHPDHDRDGALDFAELLEQRASRHRLGRQREAMAVSQISERISVELEKEKLVAGFETQVGQKKKLVDAYTADRAKLVSAGSEKRAQRHTEIAAAANAIRTKLRRFANQRQTFLALQDEVKDLPCLSGLHPHPLGLEWAQTGYRGARHGCSRPRRSPIPAFATRVPATFPR